MNATYMRFLGVACLALSPVMRPLTDTDGSGVAGLAVSGPAEDPARAVDQLEDANLDVLSAAMVVFAVSLIPFVLSGFLPSGVTRVAGSVSVGLFVFICELTLRHVLVLRRVKLADRDGHVVGALWHLRPSITDWLLPLGAAVLVLTS